MTRCSFWVRESLVESSASEDSLYHNELLRIILNIVSHLSTDTSSHLIHLCKWGSFFQITLEGQIRFHTKPKVFLVNPETSESRTDMSKKIVLFGSTESGNRSVTPNQTDYTALSVAFPIWRVSSTFSSQNTVHPSAENEQKVTKNVQDKTEGPNSTQFQKTDKNHKPCQTEVNVLCSEVREAQSAFHACKSRTHPVTSVAKLITTLKAMPRKAD